MATLTFSRGVPRILPRKGKQANSKKLHRWETGAFCCSHMTHVSKSLKRKRRFERSDHWATVTELMHCRTGSRSLPTQDRNHCLLEMMFLKHLHELSLQATNPSTSKNKFTSSCFHLCLTTKYLSRFSLSLPLLLPHPLVTF